MSRQDRWYADDVVGEQIFTTFRSILNGLEWWHEMCELEQAADKLLAVMSIEINI